MPGVSLRINPRLAASTRLRQLATTTDNPTWFDWTVLACMGTAAALATMTVNLHLRIPGHAILKAILPMAVGFAVVPRRGAGLSMSCIAVATVLGLRAVTPSGGGLSLGAITSLTTLGPLLDWSLRRARSGWPVWRAFALAGLAANVLALFVRAGAKLIGLDQLGSRPLGNWLPPAIITYAICGLLAGLVSGLICFCRVQDVDAPGDSE